MKCEAYSSGAKLIPLGRRAISPGRNPCPVESEGYSSGVRIVFQIILIKLDLDRNRQFIQTELAQKRTDQCKVNIRIFHEMGCDNPFLI